MKPLFWFIYISLFFCSSWVTARTLVVEDLPGTNVKSEGMTILAPRRGEPILKSELDKSEYVFAELGNQLRVFLSSDLHARFSNVTLHVSVGFFADPKEYSGAAKLVGMLVFGARLGDEDDDLYTFITSRDGSCALTVLETSTIINFRVPNIYLSETLKMFALVLTSLPKMYLSFASVHNLFPSNTQLYFDPEVNVSKTAVDGIPLHLFQYSLLPETWLAEHNITVSLKKMDLTQTIRRMSPHALITFYRRYYSANLMQMCIHSLHSIEDLQTLVKKNFADLPNRKIRMPHQLKDLRPPHSSDSPESVKLFFIPSTNEVLVLRWNIYENSTWKDANPIHFIQYLMCRSGEGSVKHLLREKMGLITDMKVYFDPHYFCQFTIYMELKNSKVSTVEQVIETLFESIQTLKRMVYSERLMQNWRMQNEARFRASLGLHGKFTFPQFGEWMRAADISPTHLIQAMYHSSEWQSALLQKVRGIFNAMNTTFQATRLGELGPPYEAKHEANDVACGVDVIIASLLKRLQGIERDAIQSIDITVPKLNRLAPSEDEFFTGSPPPRLVLNSAYMRFWYQQFLYYQSPKVFFRCSMINNMPFDAKNLALFELLYKFMGDAMKSFIEQASETGADIMWTKSKDALTFSVNALHSQIQPAVQIFLSTFNNLEDRNGRFMSLRNKLQLSMESSRHDLFTRAGQIRQAATCKVCGWPEQVANALKSITFSQLAIYAHEFRDSAFAEILYLGYEFPTPYVSWVPSFFKSNSNVHGPPSHVITVPKGPWHFLEVNPMFNATLVDVIVQLCVGCDPKTRALAYLFHALLLRCKLRNECNGQPNSPPIHPSIHAEQDSLLYSLRISDPNRTVLNLEIEINDFLEKSQSFLEKLSNDMLLHEVEAIVRWTHASPTNFSGIVERYWDDIETASLTNSSSKVELLQQLKGFKNLDILPFLMKNFQSFGTPELTIYLSPHEISADNIPTHSYRKFNFDGWA